VPLNSWDPAFVEMPSSSISAMRLSDMLANDVLQSESERVEDISSKLLKNRQPAEFFAHHAKLYVKFDRAQLKGLKSCQLQVRSRSDSFYNRQSGYFDSFFVACTACRFAWL
jgi:hypothetical protein